MNTFDGPPPSVFVLGSVRHICVFHLDSTADIIATMRHKTNTHTHTVVSACEACEANDTRTTHTECSYGDCELSMLSTIYVVILSRNIRIISSPLTHIVQNDVCVSGFDVRNALQNTPIVCDSFELIAAHIDPLDQTTTTFQLHRTRLDVQVVVCG